MSEEETTTDSEAKLEPFGNSVPERWLPNPGCYYSERGGCYLEHSEPEINSEEVKLW